jgi:alpha-1,2-mannosyltransferase
MRERLAARRAAVAGAAGVLALPLVPAVAATSGSLAAGLLAAAGATIVALVLVPARLPARLEEVPARHRGRAAAWCLAALVAVVTSAQLAWFVHDPAATAHSVLPFNAFFRTHSCLSSYTEAARLLADPRANVYDPAAYMDRRIGPLEIDLYQYPPAFLLLPRAALAATGDFFTIRAVWHLAQVWLLAGAMLATAAWIGGRTGTTAALLGVVFWIAVPPRLTVQIGNFQAAAFALPMLGLVLYERRRLFGGSALLGFAFVSKFFPGVLGLWLIGARQWRAVAATAAMGLFLTVLAFAVLGPTPFVHFAVYQVPRIFSGEAFFWIKEADASVINHSAYGFVSKLRTLGVPGATHETATVFASVYGLCTIAIGLVAGVRHRRSGDTATEAGRARTAQVWLALLTLASLRSPFTPDAYASIGTLWLLTLLAAATPDRSHAATAGLVLAGVSLSLVFDGLVPADPPTLLVVTTLLVQVAVVAVNVWVVLKPYPAELPMAEEMAA